MVLLGEAPLEHAARMHARAVGLDVDVVGALVMVQRALLRGDDRQVLLERGGELR
jgi:hypothetical protein